MRYRSLIYTDHISYHTDLLSFKAIPQIIKLLKAILLLNKSAQSKITMLTVKSLQNS